jgi:glycosyltransferase involved in cell wall biosynthesis
MSIFAGDPLPNEGISTTMSSSVFEIYHTRNRHFKDPSNSAYLCRQDGILEWLSAWDPDALIIEANPRHLSSRRAIKWMHRKGRPVIGWGLGAPELSGRVLGKLTVNWVQKRFRHRFLNSLDGLIAYSHRGATEYVAEGVPGDRVFVATNAVMRRPAEPPPRRSSDYQGPLKLLFVGRLQARKSLENLFIACADLPVDLQPHMWIIGDGPARSYFQSIANEMYPQTEFLGARYGEELRSYFLKADLFVLPGTGGLAVQEAMAYGLPVIVAKGDGTQEDLVRAKNGWLIPPGDIESLKRALTAALADVKSLRMKGLESYRIVQDEVNLDNMVIAFVQALNTCLTHSSMNSKNS